MSERRLVDASELVLQKDIVERLGINPTKLSNLASGRRNSLGFPRPVACRGSRGIWLWSEVESWWSRTQSESVKRRRSNAEHDNGLRATYRRRAA